MPDNSKEAFADALGVEVNAPRKKWEEHDRRNRACGLSRPREPVPEQKSGTACRSRHCVVAISRQLAVHLPDDLTADEIALIEGLEVEFGNGERLLGTDGPPPMAGREITPEEAAEILGIDLVLLERRVRAGRLNRREINGKITFSIAEVVALKGDEDRRNALMAEIYEDMGGMDKPPNEPRRKM